MNKLISCITLITLIGYTRITHAFDEGNLALPLAVTTGALAVSAYYLYQQHNKVAALTTKLQTKKATIQQLTKQYNNELKARTKNEAFLNRLWSVVPFMCVKEANTDPELVETIVALNYSKSSHPHTVPGLATYISNNSVFTDKEKNMISDEEDALNDNEDLLNEVTSIIENVKKKTSAL